MPALASSLHPQGPMSPDAEVFSTPPSTPLPPNRIPTDGTIKPSLTRRTSRPTNLHLSHRPSTEWTDPIVLDDAQSPATAKANGSAISPARPTTPRARPTPMSSTSSLGSTSGLSLGHASSSSNPSYGTVVNDMTNAGSHTLYTNGSTANGNAAAPAFSGLGGAGLPSSSPPHSIAPTPSLAMPTQRSRPQSQMHYLDDAQPSPAPMTSPCFVHSHLDNFSEWLRQKHQPQQAGSPTVGVAKALQADLRNQPSGKRIDMERDSDGYAVLDDSGLDDEDGLRGSLTKQLAETAVGVREMSKQLGRARIKSNIQSVLIVTKARDNRLIKLTRELALYLMLKRRPGGRGMVVYVDNQLRTSRRFDAAGIERDHPELFVPYPRRRSSSNNSLSSASSSSGSSANFGFTPANGKQNGAANEEPKDEGQLRYWTADLCSHSPHLFDFVVTLGGDGTVLFTSWLFQRIVPPVLPFALGSLGFLTNFDFADHRAVMDSAIDNGIRVNLRMRFTCTVYRAVESCDAVARAKGGRKAVKKADTGEIMMRNVEKGGWEALEGGYAPGEPRPGKVGGRDKEIMCFTTRPVESFEVLNDLVVDRGPSPYVSMLELFGDEHHMTTVQGDGLTIATPTGSTAYSLSAGGSLVHPEIPSILVTPICPHTLSFRPILLPDSMEVRVCVPYNSRSTAWASFDGRGRVELKQGDHIKVTASMYPFPTVCADKQSTDWFHAISRTLKWNERERQKSFVVVEEGPVKGREKGDEHAGQHEDEIYLQVEEEDEEDEEETYDIDDSTTGTVSPAATPERAAEALMGVSATASRAQALAAGGGGLRSGVDSPDRFAGPHPHPPSRHVAFAGAPTSAGAPHERTGRRTTVVAPEQEQRTPTADAHAARARSRQRAQERRSREREEASSAGHPRAFAVWGHDESDSNASDSDAS